MLPLRKNLGSMLTLILGILEVGVGVQKPHGVSAAYIWALLLGLVMIIGALIYRSAKIRRMSPDRKPLRLCLELVGVAAILFLWFAPGSLKQRFVEDPVPNLIGPIWALTAYAIAFWKALPHLSGKNGAEPYSELPSSDQRA